MKFNSTGTDDIVGWAENPILYGWAFNLLYMITDRDFATRILHGRIPDRIRIGDEVFIGKSFRPYLDAMKAKGTK